MRAIYVSVLLSAVIAVACSPAGPAAAPPSQTGQVSAPPGEEKVISASISYEPEFISTQAPMDIRGATDHFLRMFNAQADYHDDQAHGHPYLVEALPTLNTESWVVFPDGRMETRYRLKPNLTWHDGNPLTTADFVFAWQVATPENGFRVAAAPYTHMADVVATDDRSFVIRWKNIYPEAGVLTGANRWGLVPLPRHILQEVSTQGPEAISRHQYWG
jgi:ABC-type transport system substrate-binding protein